jgi:hypothetical protein
MKSGIYLLDTAAVERTDEREPAGSLSYVRGRRFTGLSNTRGMDGGAGYGTVGTCPAFSCASLAALSPLSCVGSSFDTKVPGVAAAVVAAGVLVAADAVMLVAA